MLKSRGFTLLEVLVWLAIAAIAISFVSLAVGNGSRGEQLRVEAEKLTGMMQLAMEESVLSSQPIGLRFEQELGERQVQTRYEWSQYQDGKWQPLQQHSFFLPQQLLEGLELHMSLEGRAAELSASAAAADSANDEERALAYRPDIFFLHSGEISPAFEIELQLDGQGEQYRIEGNMLGQIRLQRRQDALAEWL